MNRVPKYYGGTKTTQHHETRLSYGAKIQAQWDEIAERQDARAARSPQEQLKRLDLLLGDGVGAVKERARLTKLL